MDDAVKNITGQVEVIYEKAISELDQKEGQLDEQIGRLSQRKESLSQKRHQVNRIRDQIGNLMAEIAEAERQHDHVAGQKAELDQEIDDLTLELKDLKRHARRAHTRLENAKFEKREKYQELAAIIEKFGSVKSALPEAFVSGLKENVSEVPASVSDQRAPAPNPYDISDLSDVDEDTILEEDLGTETEEDKESFSSMDDDFEVIGDEEEDFFVDDNEEFLDEDEEELAMPSEHEEKIDVDKNSKNDTLIDHDPLVDIGFGGTDGAESALTEFDDNLDDLMPLEEESELSASTDDLDALFSQVELEGRETPEELEALERGDFLVDDEIDVSAGIQNFDQFDDDTDDGIELLDENEELTPKTARTPRKRRKLLESYLDDVTQN
ncbi:hypothetical protein CMK18_10240 [Candidatus Poribacteria bacterium]|nr:hypothetical protein [Candidatus Poribacteria bacterium]